MCVCLVYNTLCCRHILHTLLLYSEMVTLLEIKPSAQSSLNVEVFYLYLESANATMVLLGRLMFRRVQMVQLRVVEIGKTTGCRAYSDSDNVYPRVEIRERGIKFSQQSPKPFSSSLFCPIQRCTPFEIFVRGILSIPPIIYYV